jgi:L-threonylcarbamoyladenylate synthase
MAAAVDKAPDTMVNVAEFVYLAGLSPAGTLRLAALARIAAVLRSGGLAVLPTETGYMLAAVATNVDAVTDVFAAKRRSHANPVHVACASLSMAARYADLSPMGALLLGSLTPGPCTVVAAARSVLPDRLVTVSGTVGIRIPDHPATLQVLAEVDLPLTATSVNESGTAYRAPDAAVLAGLAWPAGQTVCVLDAGDTRPYSLASTLVRTTGAEPEILRAGPITIERIKQVLTV